MDKQKKISIAFPTYNEGESVFDVLSSVFSQDYPRELLEVFIVDDDSTDNTVKKAKKFPVKIIHNGTRDPEKGKLIALKKATGSFFTYIEGDLLLRGRNWFNLMLQPLIDNEKIAASFTSYYFEDQGPLINKYLTIDPIQRDPLHRFFTPTIAECIVATRDDYFICRYKKDRVVPQGLCMYRKKFLNEIYSNKTAGKDRFLELDTLVYLLEEGYDLFAYVPKAGYYHRHVKSLGDLLQKRRRNLLKVFLPDEESRKFRWADFSSLKGKIKIILWVIYAETFVLPLLVGIKRSIKYRTLLALYEPFVAWLETNILIFSLLTDKRGIRFFLKFLGFK